MQELATRTKSKVWILTVIIFSFWVLLFMRVFYIQLIRGQDYYKQAMRNRAQMIKIPAYRSVIYDRNKEYKMAYNRKSLSIIATPAYLPDDEKQREEAISNLSELIEMSIDDINSILKEQAIDKYTPVILKYDVDTRTLIHFKEHSELYPGVVCENRPRRIYSLREKAAQLVGYTGIINKEELKKLRVLPEYHSGSVLGKMGVEKYYDEMIRGKEGVLERVVDVNGNVQAENVEKDPVSGDILVLSIDKDIQELAYDQLGEKTGAVVVSKPSTGEILAMVSKPSFDPNIFTDRFTMEEFFVLKNNIDKPFLDRSIQGTYPPSSIFKLITSSAALNSGVSIHKTVYCGGQTRIGNRIFKCWNVHHTQDLISAIAYSCDVYFYTIGLLVGREPIIEYGHEYGLAKKTEIDLPGEKTGLLPEMDWFKKKYNRPWQNGDTANISIGQGDLLSTPIGINTITMALVNNGIVYKPFVLKEVHSALDQKLIWKKTPEILRKINLSPEQFEILRKGMFGVTTYGTTRWIRYATDIPIAGKTGTGEAGKEKETHALFTSFAPYGATNQDDIIAVTVVVEHGGGGSGVAAPIALAIYDYYFKKKYKIPYKAVLRTAD
jgi:penicillin-binding protein 2